MMTFELDYAPDEEQAEQAPRATAVRTSRAARHVTSEPKKEYSPQTQWMIAVRDHQDKSAYLQLFDHFAPRLKGYLMRSGMSDAQAEDIVQDAMLSVWRKAHLFDPHRAAVSSWIYQIARNRQIDVIRKEKRPVPEELKQPEETEEDASQIVGLEQELGKLRDALQTLSPDQRQMIEHAYLGELSHKDIQEKTGLPLGTIKSRIRLGLTRLRHELKGLNRS